MTEAASAPYYTFGYSVYDARKPILVQAPKAVESYATETGSSYACGAEAWTGLPTSPTPDTSTGPSTARTPLPCGLLWFTHISKTGGETVRHHLRNRVRKYGWSFLDLYTGSSPRSLRRAGRWEIERHVHVLASHLNQTRPRVVVHQHDGVGGLGDYFLERVLRPLSCRLAVEAPECKVLLTTVLRDPVARLLSQAQSDLLPAAQFSAFARAQANFMTKYMLFTTDWRVSSLFQANTSVERSLLGPARTVLSHFELVGRTEQLHRFLLAIDSSMGWGDETSGSVGGGGTVYDGHRSKAHWNLTLAEAIDARRFNAIDAELYGSFCADATATPGTPSRRVVQPLCTSTNSLRGLPHYYTPVPRQTPSPSEWRMVFDGRSCHGFHLGDAYRIECADEVHSTLGGSFGTVRGFHREKNGRLTPCPAGKSVSQHRC